MMNINTEIQALFNAIASGDLDEVQSLLSKGVSANSRNIQNQSALELASMIGNICMMEILAEAGA